MVECFLIGVNMTSHISLIIHNSGVNNLLTNIKMDDEQDVEKMTVFINKQKSAYQSNFQLEFQDFVNFKQDYSDQEFDDDVYEEGQPTLHELKIESFHIEKLPDQELVFTEEEQNIIESCTDPDLKKLLILNRKKNMQLINLHKKMQELLRQCEEEIDEKQYILKNSETKQLYQQTFAWKLAAPYFKDRKFFPSPLNEDTVRKRARNELSIYEIVPSPKWTPIEFDRLTNAVKCNYNINRQNDIVSKITALKNKMNSEDYENKNVIQEMINLKEQLEELKDDDKIPPLNSNEFVDWYKVAETFLKDKHTALECQSVWHMLVHPQINKKEWTDEENRNLEAIAKEYHYQNWDDIARELGTNRTGFTTCLHYFSKLCDKFKKSKFTPEEDRFLLDVVDIYKVGNFIPWNKVVCHFTNRSRHQLYHRYTYFLSQNHVKRGRFSEAEDILLIILVNKFGRNFKKCSEYMPHRSQVQLKSRYNSNLQRHIRKGTFTSRDDEIIYEYAQLNGEKNWTALAERLTRCNAQIRQRYKLIKNFLRDNPNSSVGDIPKRRHRFDEVNEGQYNFLNYIAEQYKNVDFIPTLSMIEESLQAKIMEAESMKSPELKVKTIDELLTDFFSNSMKIKRCNVITEANLSEAAENAKEVLKLLDANLNIPEKLECNACFDDIDLEILERLSKETKGSTQTRIDKLIPPNISTLVGLRSLIIKHKEYKSQQKEKHLPSTSKSDHSTLPGEQTPDKKDILVHQELFSKRFDVLFDWCAVLSLEKPNNCDVLEKDKSNDVTLTASPLGKTCKKRPTSESSVVVKRRKITTSALANLSRHPQLKIVDKHVVEHLVKKNNINVIRLDSVVSPSVVKKAMQRRSKPSTTQVTCTEEIPQVTSSTGEVTEQVDDDLSNGEMRMLKTMKSEVNGEPSSYNEEYKAIKDDVQLLKEILKYEKVKVKPDPDSF